MKPEAQAERLLWEVLPKDLYFHYAAFGWFSIPVNGRKYYLYKNIKTQSVDQDGTHLSWCIHSSRKVPDQDRLVSEYLLLTNNEAEYLRTANGTVVGGPNPQVRAPINWGMLPLNIMIGIAMAIIAAVVFIGLIVGMNEPIMDALSVPAIPPIASPSHDPGPITGFIAYQTMYKRGDLAEKPLGWKEDKAASYSGVLNYVISDDTEKRKPVIVGIPECPGRRVCSLSSTEVSVFIGANTSGLATSVAWASAGVTTFGTEVH